MTAEIKKAKKFILKTMGCKTNQLESRIMFENLIENGFCEAQNFKCADFFILNSCTVTQKSDSEAFYLVNKAKRENPDIKVVLAGCVAQVNKDFSENFPENVVENVDIILGNGEKLEISKYLTQKFAVSKSPKTAVSDIFQNKTFENKFIKNFNLTRADVKIQDGCNNRCSYCIIPYARGNSRSNSIENIIKQINILTENDFKEVVLTGIHIGQWGLDFSPSENPLGLLELLKEIEKTEILRYRLGSLTPDEITDEMIDFLKNSKKFCPHFHLSLQSACNKVLADMKRNYTVEFYLDLIEKLNKNFKNPFLGSDIIVGFPTETEKDFQTTYENLESSNLSKIHVFPFSLRKNTYAEKLKNVVKNKEQRARKLNELSKKLHKKFLEKNVGQTLEILVENRRDKDGKLKGLSGNYVEMSFEGKDCLKNTFVKINY